jgi:outer membrane protein TolC
MKRSLAILGVVLLAGCIRFQPQTLSPANTATELDSRSLTNPALKTLLEKNLRCELTNWPALSWDFPMLTFAACYYHPSLEVARNEWRLAQAGTKTAAGRPNPTVTVTPGFDPSIPGNPVPWVVPVILDVPIETAGKRGRRIQTARHFSESAQLNIASVAWQVRSTLRSSLLDLAAARQRGALLARQLSTQEQIVKLLRQQAEAGAIAAAELAPAGVALARANADLAESHRQLADARPRVAEAIGVPVAALDAVTLSFDLEQLPVADRLTSADVRHTALQSRADILTALADYAASQSALQLEIAKQYPDVRLSPGYIFNAGSAGDSQWELGLTVELPVLNRNQGPIAEAEARRAIAASRFIALQSKVIGEIDRVVAVYGASLTNLAALQRLAAAQKAQSETVEAQFKAGALEQLDVRRAQLELTAAQLVELDSKIKLQQAAGALEDAVQRPLDETVATPAVLRADPRASLPTRPK